MRWIKTKKTNKEPDNSIINVAVKLAVQCPVYNNERETMEKFKSKTKVGLISIPEVLDSNNDLDWKFLEKVESLAGECFKNPRYKEVYHLHNEWNNHVGNILGYIAL